MRQNCTNFEALKRFGGFLRQKFFWEDPGRYLGAEDVRIGS